MATFKDLQLYYLYLSMFCCPDQNGLVPNDLEDYRPAQSQFRIHEAEHPKLPQAQESPGKSLILSALVNKTYQ